MKQILRYRVGVLAAINAAVSARQKSTTTADKLERDLLRRLQPFATSGKLLRGSLLCYMYYACSGRAPTKAVYKVAAALELAHAGLLMHDDVMDQDILRRGKPTMHQQYQDFAASGKLADQKHFGESMAICAGDFALFLSLELVAEARVNPKIIGLFSQQLTTVCAGQMQDIYGAASPALPTKAAIYRMMQTKTASYSVSLPLVIGATLGGATAIKIKTLHELGLCVGTIFQIRDDELGILGNEEVLGKSAQSDIHEGKKTLLYYYLLKNCSVKDAQRVKAIFGNPAATNDDISTVREMTIQYGVPTLLAKDVAHLSLQARSCIAALGLSANVCGELLEFVAFCATRHT